MKKFIFILAVLSSCLFASDELNIDSLFKKQIGLRSITSLSLLILYLSKYWSQWGFKCLERYETTLFKSNFYLHFNSKF